MEYRPITATKRSQRRRWGEQCVPARNFYGALVAARGPPECSAMRQGVGLAPGCDHAAVGQFVRATRQGMQPFAPVVEPFGVQDCVQFRSPRHLYRAAERPRVTKCFRRFTTAEEARAVSCRERDRLVQKEQLGPAAATHDHPAAPPKFAETNE